MHVKTKNHIYVCSPRRYTCNHLSTRNLSFLKFLLLMDCERILVNIISCSIFVNDIAFQEQTNRHVRNFLNVYIHDVCSTKR